MLTVSTGIDFPNAAQAIQIRRRLDEPKRFTTETVYAITDPHIHQAKPRHLAAWIRGHWAIENKIHWVRDVTSWPPTRAACCSPRPHTLRHRCATRSTGRWTTSRHFVRGGAGAA
jgi:hypothetical protein